MKAIIKRWVEDRYGSKRGFLNTCRYLILGKLGAYGRYKDIDWARVNRLVFICKGNICRSAYAEAIAKSLGMDAVSCGIDTIEDSPANIGAIEAAERSGVSLHGHTTTPIMYLVLRKTDLLIAMEPWHLHFLETQLYRKHQITLLGIWGNEQLPHLQDPYETNSDYFDRCFCRIRDAVKIIAKEVLAK